MQILDAKWGTEMTKNRIVTWDADDDITDLVDELNGLIGEERRMLRGLQRSIRTKL